MRTELEYWNEMAGGGKQNMGNQCPGDVLSKEHQVLVLAHWSCRPRWMVLRLSFTAPVCWGSKTPTGF